MKKFIRQQIHRITIPIQENIRFRHLPLDLLPNDILDFEIDEEGHVSDNESYPPYQAINIYREREETDEEYNARINEAARAKEFMKKQRYESYLKLKAEFEPNEIPLQDN